MEKRTNLLMSKIRQNWTQNYHSIPVHFFELFFCTLYVVYVLLEDTEESELVLFERMFFLKLSLVSPLMNLSRACLSTECFLSNGFVYIMANWLVLIIIIKMCSRWMLATLCSGPLSTAVNIDDKWRVHRSIVLTTDVIVFCSYTFVCVDRKSVSICEWALLNNVNEVKWHGKEFYRYDAKGFLMNRSKVRSVGT